MPISEVYNEDCMVAMKRYPDKFFDLAIVDPPFFKGVANGSFYGSAISTKGVKRVAYRKIPGWDFSVPNEDYYLELLRVSWDQIIWGINYFPDFPNVPCGRIVWDKRNDSATFSNCEIASCSLIDSVRIFRYTWNGFMQEKGMRKEERIHVTQKPIKLYSWLLDKFSKPNFKILDTHMGSQSSRIAAFQMGLDYYGMEIDKYVFNDGCQRFEEQTAQIKLF